MNELLILSQILGEPKKLTKKNEYLFFCPNNHHKQKLQINIVTGDCHCWVCGISHKSLYTFAKKHFPSQAHLFLSDKKAKKSSTIGFENEFEESDNKRYLSLPDSFCKLTKTSKDPNVHNAIVYLFKRGLSWRHIEKYNIGIMNDDSLRIVIPSYNASGNLNYYIARSIYANSKIKYKNPYLNRSELVPFESTIDTNYSITLVEGVFDAIKISHNTIPLLGCSLKSNWAIFKKLLNCKKKIYLCLDNDKAGIEGTINIAKLLLGKDKEVYYINLSPYKDAGELDKKEFLQKKKQSILIDEWWLMQKQTELI